ncbi:MAG: cadherin-like beta sandwich domain-containing protein [Ruminococcus sp.]|nr:cadherin-like beta sandwich domain-containing protein [Ruminococcus sp.]
MMLRKLLSLAVAFLFAAALPCFSVSAQQGAFITLSEDPAEGEELTVTLTFAEEDNIGYVSSQLYYDESCLEFVTGDAVGGGGLLNIRAFPVEDPTEVTLSLTFRTLSAGYSALELRDSYVFSPDGIVLDTPEATQIVEVSLSGEVAPDQTSSDSEGIASQTGSEADSSPDDSLYQTSESSRADLSKALLSAIYTDTGSLEPEFAPEIFQYRIFVGADTDSVTLSAGAYSDQDMVSYSGGGPLETGSNIRTFTVESPDGSRNVYTVDIVRSSPEETVEKAAEEQPDSSTISSESTVSSSSARDSSTPSDERDQLKDSLNLALAVTLIVLVVALAIVIMWIKGRHSKSKKKRRGKKRK